MPIHGPTMTPTSQPTEEICTCAPKRFDITIDLMTTICNVGTPETLTNNPGIDPPVVCGITLLGDDFDLNDAQDIMMDPPQALFYSQKLQDFELTTIFVLGFVESRLGGRSRVPQFFSSDGGYPTGEIFPLTSIADSIVESDSTPIAQQLDSVPVRQDILWIGEISGGSRVLGFYSWAFDTSCDAPDLTSILDGDVFGFNNFNQVVEQPFDYCLVPTSSPSTSSMPSSMPSNQPSSQPSEPPNTPLIKETPEPTLSPVTPFPTISPTGGSTPTVGKDISTPPTMIKRTSETDVEQEASNDLANLTLTEKVTKDCVQHYDEAWSTKRNAVVTGCVNVCQITTTVYQGDVEKSSEVETTKEICDN